MSALTVMHVFLSPIVNESRLFREADSLSRMSSTAKVVVAGIWEPGLQDFERRSESTIIHRLRLRTRSLSKSLPVQLLKYFEWGIRVLRVARSCKPQIIHCHSIAALPVGVVCKLFTGASLLYDAHELESEKQGLSGIRKRLVRFLERLLIRRAEAVIVVGETIADWYRESYGIERPTVIMNVPRYREVQSGDLLRKRLGIARDCVIFLYQGVLSPGRGIREMCEAFSNIGGRRALVLLGYGSQEPLARAAAAESPHIFFHPAVPPDDLLSYTAGADYGLSLIEDSCLSYRYCMPNKLFEYFMAGLPVLVSALPEMSRVIRNEGVGVIAGDVAKDEIAAATVELEALDGPELRKRVARAATRYCWENVEGLLVEQYRRLLHSGADG